MAANRRAVKSYAIGWYPGSNRAQVTLVLEDGAHQAVPIESAAELAAVAAVLREPRVFLYASGLLASGDGDATG